MRAIGSSKRKIAFGETITEGVVVSFFLVLWYSVGRATETIEKNEFCALFSKISVCSAAETPKNRKELFFYGHCGTSSSTLGELAWLTTAKT